MGHLGMGELLIVLMIVLLVFGASRLPQIGEGLGKAIKGLKRGLNSDDEIEITPRDKQVSEASSAKKVETEATDAEIVHKS